LSVWWGSSRPSRYRTCVRVRVGYGRSGRPQHAERPVGTTVGSIALSGPLPSGQTEVTTRTARSTGVSPATSSRVIPLAGVFRSARSRCHVITRHLPTADMLGESAQAGARRLVRQPPRSQDRSIQAGARGEVGIGRALGSQGGGEHVVQGRQLPQHRVPQRTDALLSVLLPPVMPSTPTTSTARLHPSDHDQRQDIL
jgi:hypothetical protein